MEIKVECPCGQRYRFEVEPERGRMPVAVTCPSCGGDGTAAANAFIQAVEGGPAASSRPVPQPMTDAARPAVRVHTPEAPVVPAAATQIPALPSVPAAASATPLPPAPAHAAPGSGRLLPGVAGALIAGFLGMMGWFLLIKLTNTQWGIAAWGVGFLVGFGTRTLARQCSVGLGIAAGVCALVAILGGQFLAIRSAVHQLVGEEAGKAVSFEAILKRAQQAEKEVPTGSDDEIRAFLAREQAAEGLTGSPASITEDEIKEFRSDDWPNLKDIASGKRSRTDIESERSGLEAAIARSAFKEEVLSLWTLLWLFLGVGSAYRLASGRSG